MSLFPFEAQVEDLQDPPDASLVFIDVVDDAGELIERLCTTIPRSPRKAMSSAMPCATRVSEPGSHIILFSAEDTEGNVGTAQGQLGIQSSDEVDNDGDDYTELEGDCDDTDEDVHPGAFEYENGLRRRLRRRRG